MTPRLKYRRVLVKVSGEVLGLGIEPFHLKAVQYIANQIAAVRRMGVRIGIVIGGGNIMRGKATAWMERIDADTCGIMATIVNGLVLAAALRRMDIDTCVSSPIEVKGIIRTSNRRDDLARFDEGTVMIFVGGTGNPLFTTDTAAALAAVQMNTNVLIKGTKVDGVYSADPMKQTDAVLYRHLDYGTAIRRDLAVMDLYAFNICREAGIPIFVYNLMRQPLTKVIRGTALGTLVQ